MNNIYSINANRVWEATKTTITGTLEMFRANFHSKEVNIQPF